MEWLSLDIRKAALVKKEVDVALLALEQSEGTRRAAVLSSFQSRIDELDEFRAANESDDRAILFERERLRLRKAVQEAFSTSSSVPATPATESTTATRKTPSTKQQRLFSKPPATPYVETSSFGEDEEKRIATTTTKKVKTPAKIYEWEGKKIENERGMISVDGNVYAPCAEVGMYVSAKEDVEESEPEQYIDLQIVLNKHEITLLASRIHKLGEGDFKSQMSSGSVHHQTPYVDTTRVMKDLYRPEQPGKWTAEKPMRPNAKR